MLGQDRSRAPYTTRKCLVVAQHLSHYRTETYQELERSDGWEFEFAGGRTSRDPGIPGVPTGALENVHYLEETWLLGRVLWQHGLFKLCRVASFDALILEGNAAYLSTWIVLVWARFQQIPTYLWTIGWHRPDRGLKGPVRRAMYRMADRILLYGEDAREYAISLGFPSESLVVVGNSVGHIRAEQRAIAKSRTSASRDKRELVVGAVVRLRELKRLDLLIRAVAKLRAQGQAVRVLLVGEGESRERLETLADELRVPVEFRGAVYDPELLDVVYRELDLTVIPMYAGLSVIQSLGYGVPVITADDPNSQVPEFRAVIPGVTGELYKTGDVNALAEAIKAWMLIIRRESDQVASGCVNEVEARWTSVSQAGRIVAAMEEA